MSCKMCILEDFVLNLYEVLTGIRNCDNNIIRKHSRKLEQLGDISFPLSIKNWYNFIDKHNLHFNNLHNIFDYKVAQGEIDMQILKLKEKSKSWHINIERSKVNDNDISIFLKRSPQVFEKGIEVVITKGQLYGSAELLQKQVLLNLDCDIQNENYAEIDLSTLRLLLLRDVTFNIVKLMTNNQNEGSSKIVVTMNSLRQDQTVILCGPVLNNNNIKDNVTKAEELLAKRTADMRMMAQHKYGVQVKSSSLYKTYFEKLGKAAVTIEMLSNKPHKPLKVVMHDLQSAHKGASFIFYNCARLAKLFKELQKRISEKIYPELPTLKEIDFSLLNQPEEWELFYVYILQFPITIKNCIKDIEKGSVNPQYLISYLSGLSSVFSGYYRRVRILMDPREHLYATLYARIYLLKAVQCVFHNALYLLNIEPIKEM